ncbi:MAG: hypothetical protein AAF569_03590 [Pseudomonadota bacterium]
MAFPSALEIVSSLILASSAGECIQPETTAINVIPTTNQIQYDFSKTDAELTQVETDTVNPYGPGVDLVTKGLRHEKPHMEFKIEFGTQGFARTASFCAWYKQIDVNITLSPKIYIAKGYTKGECGKFILEHEKKHVRVDREVMNKYSRKMGEAILKTVNATGPLGPFELSAKENVRQNMTKHIENVINPIVEEMKAEMRVRQQAVDSKEEYDLGSAICRDLTLENMRAQQHKH